MLGAAHFKLYLPRHGQAWLYVHVFYKLDASPPFALRSTSRPFILPAPFGNPYRDRIQFAAGLAAVGEGDDARFVLTYGVADCAAMAVNLSYQFVMKQAKWDGWPRFHPNRTHLGTW